MKSIRVRTPAKVNLFLRVLRGRPDGYHDIESLFQAIDLEDELIIEKIQGTSVLEAPGFPNLENEENLIIKAVRWIERETDAKLQVRIRLNKIIPIAAGLGGGSTDAAAALMGICSLFNLQLPEEAIYRGARTLGADVPFFLKGGSAVGEGVGDVLTPVDLPLDYGLLLVNSGFPVSTAAVYREYSASLTGMVGTGKLWTRIREHQDLASLLYNDLQAPAERLHPEISEVRIFLEGAGLKKSLMSGSGPTIFGIGDPGELSGIRELVPKRWHAFLVRPVKRGLIMD